MDSRLGAGRWGNLQGVYGVCPALPALRALSSSAGKVEEQESSSLGTRAAESGGEATW